MLISFQCDRCDSRLEIEAAHSGERVPCPTCGAPLNVPAAAVGPGATIGGFRIDRLIGEGGMGRVFLARQLSMDRSVALKILPAAMAADPKIVDRFVQEVRLSARLDHAHLVTAYEAGQDHGVLFFAMAYVPGRTLYDQLQAEGPMTEESALRITLKIATALAYAWTEHRLLHRDIKPANILLDARGEPKLADLGLARTIEQDVEGLTLPGAILGTPNYMSPEAVEGRPLDPRSDLYSLGATLWSMLTARVPFEGEPLNAVLRRQAADRYPDVRRWNPAVSTATLALLDRMLEKDPKRRFRSWEDLLAALEDLLLHRSLRPGRPRMLAALLLLALTLLLGVSGAALWALRRARARPPAATAPPAVPDAPAAPAEIPAAPPAVPDAPPEDPADLLFRAARDYLREHPEDRAGAVQRFRELARRFPDGPLGRRARDEAQRLERGPPTPGLGVHMNRLRREADAMMARGEFENLIRSFGEYDGPFTAETAGFRAIRIEQARAAAAERDRRAADRRARFAEGSQAAAALVLRGDRAGAKARFEALAGDPALADRADEARALAAAVAALPDRNARVLQTFRALAGTDATVELRDGRVETYGIVGVSASAGTVIARKESPQGFAEIELLPAQLSPRETWNRLGDDAAPETRLARGLLAAERGMWPVAAEEFAAAPGPLAAALAAEARRLAAPAAP